MVGGEPWEDHYDWCLCPACINMWTLDKVHRTDVSKMDCSCESCVLKEKRQKLAEARKDPTKFHFKDCDCILCEVKDGTVYKPDPNKPHPIGCVCATCIQEASDAIDAGKAFSSTAAG